MATPQRPTLYKQVSQPKNWTNHYQTPIYIDQRHLQSRIPRNGPNELEKSSKQSDYRVSGNGPKSCSKAEQNGLKQKSKPGTKTKVLAIILSMNETQEFQEFCEQIYHQSQNQGETRLSKILLLQSYQEFKQYTKSENSEEYYILTSQNIIQNLSAPYQIKQNWVVFGSNEKESRKTILDIPNVVYYSKRLADVRTKLESRGFISKLSSFHKQRSSKTSKTSKTKNKHVIKSLAINPAETYIPDSQRLLSQNSTQNQIISILIHKPITEKQKDQKDQQTKKYAQSLQIPMLRSKIQDSLSIDLRQISNKLESSKLQDENKDKSETVSRCLKSKQKQMNVSNVKNDIKCRPKQNILPRPNVLIGPGSDRIIKLVQYDKYLENGLVIYRKKEASSNLIQKKTIGNSIQKDVKVNTIQKDLNSRGNSVQKDETGTLIKKYSDYTVHKDETITPIAKYSDYSCQKPETGRAKQSLEGQFSSKQNCLIDPQNATIDQKIASTYLPRDLKKYHHTYDYGQYYAATTQNTGTEQNHNFQTLQEQKIKFPQRQSFQTLNNSQSKKRTSAQMKQYLDNISSMQINTEDEKISSNIEKVSRILSNNAGKENLSRFIVSDAKSNASKISQKSSQKNSKSLTKLKFISNRFYKNDRSNIIDQKDYAHKQIVDVNREYFQTDPITYDQFKSKALLGKSKSLTGRNFRPFQKSIAKICAKISHQNGTDLLANNRQEQCILKLKQKKPQESTIGSSNGQSSHRRKSHLKASLGSFAIIEENEHNQPSYLKQNSNKVQTKQTDEGIERKNISTPFQQQTTKIFRQNKLKCRDNLQEAGTQSNLYGTKNDPYGIKNSISSAKSSCNKGNKLNESSQFRFMQQDMSILYLVDHLLQPSLVELLQSIASSSDSIYKFKNSKQLDNQIKQSQSVYDFIFIFWEQLMHRADKKSYCQQGKSCYFVQINSYLTRNYQFNDNDLVLNNLKFLDAAFQAILEQNKKRPKFSHNLQKNTLSKDNKEDKMAELALSQYFSQTQPIKKLDFYNCSGKK